MGLEAIGFAVAGAIGLEATAIEATLLGGSIVLGEAAGGEVLLDEQSDIRPTAESLQKATT